MSKPFWVIVNHEAEGMFRTAEEAIKFANKIKKANPTFHVIAGQEKENE